MLGQSHLTLRPCGVLSRSPGSLGTGFQGLPLVARGLEVSPCPQLVVHTAHCGRVCPWVVVRKCSYPQRDARRWSRVFSRRRAPRSALCLRARIGRAVTFSGTLCAQVSSRRPLPADWKLEVPLPSVVHNALKRGFSSGDASLFPPVSAQIRTAQCALALEGGLSSGDASFFPPVSAQIGTASYPWASNLC